MGHPADQQMTLAVPEDTAETVVANWDQSVLSILNAAETPIASRPRLFIAMLGTSLKSSPGNRSIVSSRLRPIRTG